MPGEDRSVDGLGEDHAAAVLQAYEGVAPSLGFRSEVRAGDRDQPSTGGETGQRRGDMTIRSIRHPSLDIGHDRERRIHQHQRRHGVLGQMIVDLGGVEPGDGIGRKEGREKIGAGLGKLVEDQRAASSLRQDRHQAGAGRRLQHHIVRRDRGRRQRGKAERQRRAELLEALAFFGAAGLRRQQPGDLRQRIEPGNRRTDFAEKRLSVFAE